MTVCGGSNNIASCIWKYITTNNTRKEFACISLEDYQNCFSYLARGQVDSTISVLTTLQSLSCQLYYRRKLATYNLSVFDLASKHGYCYMWQFKQHCQLVKRWTKLLQLVLTSVFVPVVTCTPDMYLQYKLGTILVLVLAIWALVLVLVAWVLARSILNICWFQRVSTWADRVTSHPLHESKKIKLKPWHKPWHIQYAHDDDASLSGDL